MRFDDALLLKWLEAEHPMVQGRTYVVSGKCVLSARDFEGRVVGLTVFEPRSLTQDFFSRLASRQERYPDCSFDLHLPRFLEHRLGTLMGARPGLRLRIHYTSYLHIQNAEHGFILRDQLRVMCVDDSPVLLKFLKHSIEELGYARVVSQVSDSRAATNEILKNSPDVITMDIQMPGMSGVELVKQLLAKKYFPVVMVSSLSPEHGTAVFDALNAGAFDYIQKPKLEERESFGEELEDKLLLAATGRVLSLRPTSAASTPEVAYPPNLVWCLGASTGGTQALTRFFTSLPAKIPPTLVVQHIPPVYSRAFADSLNELCPFDVKEAEDGEELKANCVFIAPGGRHMGIARRLGRSYVALSDAEPVNRFRPSVDYMFEKVAESSGLQIVAALLTGMGKDGAAGLLKLKEQGAYTLAQDEESSAVFGMPRAAIELGAANEVLGLDAIAQAFLAKAGRLAAVG